ncbi:hypothetical protein HIM_11335 [Hirsutella minnesotensis 3608]|uniref:Uncharacterized protein n=1 Tax=Hirsutella minnesotensis 3608 TaxID=1043627 RepID=A0A0F7ZFK0_9HYPO|nr:hypothetical protein HIM_11335 [Hirsutella minnesotensis 3608]
MARGECWLPPETAARVVPLEGGEGAAILRWGRTSCGPPRLPAKAEAKPIPFDGSEGPAALHVGLGRMSRGASELLVGGGEGPPALHVGCDRMSRGASELLVGGGEGPAASTVGRGRISLGTRWLFPKTATALEICQRPIRTVQMCCQCTSPSPAPAPAPAPGPAAPPASCALGPAFVAFTLCRFGVRAMAYRGSERGGEVGLPPATTDTPPPRPSSLPFGNPMEQYGVVEHFAHLLRATSGGDFLQLLHSRTMMSQFR